MIFALGFLAAGLLGLLFLPALSGRAMRLARRRVERQLPLSIEEIVAERDRLRAEFAVTQRQIEQKAERVVRTRAADLGELGRRAKRIADLEAELAGRRSEIVEKQTVLDETRRDLASSETELGALRKALYDTSGLLDRTRAAMEEAKQEGRRLAEERRVLIATLQTSLEAANAKIESLQLWAEDAGRAMQKKQHELQEAVNAREAAAADLSLLRMRHTALEARLEAQGVHVADIESGHSPDHHQPLIARMTGHLAAAVDHKGMIAAQAARIAELEGKLRESAEAAADAERRLWERIEALHAERTSIEGALEAARREREGLRAQLEAARSAGLESTSSSRDEAALEALLRVQEENALLRRSIVEVAAEVRRLTATEAGIPAPRTAEMKPRRERAGRGKARGPAAEPQSLPDHGSPAHGQTARTSQ